LNLIDWVCMCNECTWQRIVGYSWAGIVEDIAGNPQRSVRCPVEKPRVSLCIVQGGTTGTAKLL